MARQPFRFLLGAPLYLFSSQLQPLADPASARARHALPAASVRRRDAALLPGRALPVRHAQRRGSRTSPARRRAAKAPEAGRAAAQRPPAGPRRHHRSGPRRRGPRQSGHLLSPRRPGEGRHAPGRRCCSARSCGSGASASRMTRTTDTLIALGDRGGYCTEACDLFVSIHVNSLARRRGYTEVRGFETFFLAEAQDRGRGAGGARWRTTRSGSRRARPRAEDRGTRLHPQGPPAQRASPGVRSGGRAGADEVSKTVHTGPDRGVKQAGFMVLTTARRPGHPGRAGLQHQSTGRPALDPREQPEGPRGGDRRRQSWSTCGNTSARPAGPTARGRR